MRVLAMETVHCGSLSHNHNFAINLGLGVLLLWCHYCDLQVLAKHVVSHNVPGRDTVGY